MKDRKEDEIISFGQKRRTFLKTAGVGVLATALIAAGCKKKNDDPSPGDGKIDLGSGDTGILNYAYALEQLEAAFYTTVVANSSFTTIYSTSEQTILKDIKAHEIVHREFFKTALGTSAIQALQVDFSTIDFKSRTSVLGAAKTFEDLGVAAYNGAGKLFSAAGIAYLGLAGKIVSVEARHASTIRDLINPKSKNFAGDDVVSVSQGLDGAKTPIVVLESANVYLITKVSGNNLPTA